MGVGFVYNREDDLYHLALYKPFGNACLCGDHGNFPAVQRARQGRVCKQCVKELGSALNRPPWPEDEEGFRRNLKVGHLWANLAADYFRCLGLHVDVPEQTIRKDISEADTYTKHDLDMTIEGVRIEVKSRSLKSVRFTSVKDFPYPAPLIDTVRGWDAKIEVPRIVLCVSQVRDADGRWNGAGIWLPVIYTRDEWLKEPHWDSERNMKRRELFYVCRKSLWHDMPALIRSLRNHKGLN